MTIQHHPDVSTLMAYAAGSLGEALSTVVIAHLVRCPQCRADVRRLENFGAALLDDMPPTALERSSEIGHRLEASAAHPPLRKAGHVIPDPLGQVLSDGLANFRWRWLGPGVWHHRLPLTSGTAGDLRLLKIAAGRQMPAHGHGGCELTLVVEGSYRDETGVFGPGDIEDVDTSVEHQPAADQKTGCICLIASERAARFKGVMGRLIHPLTGM